MAQSGLKTTGRIILALGGGYWATSASFVLFAFLMIACGLPRVEATTLSMMLAFLLYPCLIMWVFGARRIGHPFVVFCALIVAGHIAPFFFSQGH